ncbi:cysteine-rich receptor-like protein kinase 25 [Olea europaea var. sylvestris]|uniref:cysteine-rich receptor-like protein kinase 25 n=1 Tax=Olea europaea var. sylvestris TaxID=158386 RepID=UPI000C1D5D13|nr:cysteine-rich receptor-like protein kinase 25 [Olea europaea var. sylvestris]
MERHKASTCCLMATATPVLRFEPVFYFVDCVIIYHHLYKSMFESSAVGFFFIGRSVVENYLNLDNSFCGEEAVCDLFYALRLRAIVTGKFFLNSTEEEDCSIEMKGTEADVLGLFVLIGGIFGFFVVLLSSAWILSRRRHKLISPVNKEAWKSALSALSKEPAILKVPVEKVYAATNNLHESNFIGQGTSGNVYKGLFSGNQQVAIKHITKDGGAETFVREVGSLAHIRHPNLVALLGYCESEGECFLIYELCPNGNLSEWLYGNDKVLSWIQRLQIAIGSARGLWFLHTFQEDA